MSSATVIAARNALRQSSVAPPRRGLAWGRLLSILGLAAALGLPAILAVVSELRSSRTASTIRVVLGGTPYELPSGLVRPSSRGEGDVLRRIDLAFAMPDVAPVRPSVADDPGPAGRQDLGTTVLVAVTVADQTMPDPATRLADLHTRFLGQTLADAPGGLMMRLFKANSPYDGESLVFAPPDGRLFWARCTGKAPDDHVAPVCLTEIRRGGLDFQIRFDPRQLAEWDAIVSAATRIMAEARR
jgi:hypothetical protein